MTKSTRSTSSRTPRTVAEWWEAANDAENDEDFPRAIVCYRRALEMAPFCRELRNDFSQVLDAQYVAEHGGERKGLLGILFKSAPATESRGRKGSTREEEFDPADDESWEDRPSFLEVVTDLMPNSRTLAVGASGVFAVALTVAGIFAAGAFSNMVGGIFTSNSLPELIQPSLPNELESVLADANALAYDGDAKRAVEKLRDVKIQYPDYSDEIDGALVTALRSVGSEESRDRNYMKAADAFREAAELDPSRAINWIDLGRSLRDEARIGLAASETSKQRSILDDAEAAFQQALEIAPNDPVAMFGLAKVYDARNNRSRAADTYADLLERAPDSTEAGMARVALAQLRR